MAFNLFGNETVKSPEQLSKRRALVRALMTRQLSQRPRDTWDGINNLVGAISSRIAQDQLDKAETIGQLSVQTKFAPLIEALKRKWTPDAGSLTAALSNPWLKSDQRSVAENLYKR